MVEGKTDIHLEIDYQKLAEAIVQAQNEARKEEKLKKKKHTRFRNAVLGFVNGTVYHGIFGCCLVIILGIWGSFLTEHKISLLVSIIATVLFAIIGFISFLCGQETLDDDYETTVHLLDLNISIVAMVIAMISLLNSVR